MVTTAGGLMRYHYAVSQKQLPDRQELFGEERDKMHSSDGGIISGALKQKIANQRQLGVY